MANALDGLRVKSDRAYKHIKEMEEAVRLFLDSHPYTVGIEHNAQTGNMEWRLLSAEDIPLPISGIAGDAIQNLRSALDHLIWQLVLMNGGTPTRITGFPIAESLQEYTSTKFRRKVEGARQADISQIDSLKPYQGGNELLWRLHRLNNIDKHRLLLPAASALIHHDLLPSQRERLKKIFMGSHPTAKSPPDLKGVVTSSHNALFPLEVGKVFFAVPRSEMEHDFKFTLGIAFNEVGVRPGEEIVNTLHQFSSGVDQIIGIFAPDLFHFIK